MRKLFWCCTAALVGAGSLTAAAYQACRHPDSMVGQGVRLAAETALPVQVLRGLKHTVTAHQAGTAAEEPGNDLVPAEPRPAAVEPHTVAATPMSRQVVKAEPPAEEPPPAIVFPEPEPEGTGSEVRSEPPEDPLLVTKREVKRPAVMPYVSDEEDAPKTMPMVNDEEEKGKQAKSSVLPAWLGFFFKQAASSRTEPSEAVEPEGTSGCQEDPDYHRHYPGCPYTGGSGSVCPHTGHDKPTAVPKQPKGGEEASEEEAPARKIEHHHANKPNEKDDSVRQPNVDTMEYRPGVDGPLDEQGNHGPF